jgi:hypothetical protein
MSLKIRKENDMKKNSLFLAIFLGFILLLVILIPLSFRKNVPGASAAELPRNLPTPTPYATALPGISVQVMQEFAHGEILTQEANGVEVSAANFRVEQDQLMVDVCYQAPDTQDWLVSNVIARIGDKEIPYHESRAIVVSHTLKNGRKQIVSFQRDSSTGDLIEQTVKEVDSDNLPDYRCTIIIFRLEPGMSTSSVTIVLKALRVSERVGEVCDTYLKNMQSVLDAENTGIRLDCVKQDYGEFPSIAEKPASMSDEDAQRLVSEARRKIYTIEGPWIFEGKIE